MGGERMKIFIYLFIFISVIFSQDNLTLLDRFQVKNYLLEIRKSKQKKCYLYFFKKENKDYSFYRAYDLLTPNAYFYGGAAFTYDRKKKKQVYKTYFFDVEKAYKGKRINKRFKRLLKDTLGTLRMIGGKEIKADDAMVKKEEGNSHSFNPNAFYGDRIFHVALMKNNDIGVYKSKKKVFDRNIGGYTGHQAYSYASRLYGSFSGKYPEMKRDKHYYVFSVFICPQITPPKKYQKPMLNTKIKPYKNLAGNRIE